nr:MAG TPA_asm: hypothetical protein [Caudoviricetes sp.]DAU04647.1 MAG TPA: hypothetical protein [Caudoviricetes sp.]
MIIDWKNGCALEYHNVCGTWRFCRTAYKLVP